MIMKVFWVCDLWLFLPIENVKPCQKLFFQFQLYFLEGLIDILVTVLGVNFHFGYSNFFSYIRIIELTKYFKIVTL